MSKEPSPAQKAIGDISPKLAQLTDDVHSGWPKAMSALTVAREAFKLQP